MTTLPKDMTDQGASASRLIGRRDLLKGAAAASAVVLTAPAFIKSSRASSSGELNLLSWSDEFPDPVIQTSRRLPASR